MSKEYPWRCRKWGHDHSGRYEGAGYYFHSEECHRHFWMLGGRQCSHVDRIMPDLREPPLPAPPLPSREVIIRRNRAYGYSTPTDISPVPRKRKR